MKIEVQVNVVGSLTAAWNAWTTPSSIQAWNFASDDWCCPRAELTFEVGGRFNYRMESKDGQFGFDFEGTFTNIVPHKEIAYKMDDDRHVTIYFTEHDDKIVLLEQFDAESIHSIEQQKEGWQCILNNFKKHVENGDVRSKS
ncbi:SRPBCC domain-containing protein [Pseudoalteromonas xiamenensis]|uniref:SRPBCC domain-containing protein n=1 Tax=Pseudoalteromonas xiamenensis TaxID=882626 RepID=A0A975HL48_9GAMM|nr:SRPBCC domain-containing protein [Pseudoalteromonas xiamenensis]QTH71711.1 SRPBCC domain-containing protein [Pseudoalteromonas xiamenensis]